MPPPTSIESMRWETTWQGNADGWAVVLNGRQADRATALDAAVRAGLEFIRESNGQGGALHIQVGEESGWIYGLSDNPAEGALIQRVEAAFVEEAQRQQKLREDAEAAAARGPILSSTSPSSVDEQWTRIERWLEAHRPGVADEIEGAELAQIESAEMVTGEEWPSELTALYGQVNGVSIPALLPMHHFMSLDELLESRQGMVDAWGQFDWAEPGEFAGETAGTFLPEFLPFAGLDSYYLFVDTRPGPLNGSVTEFADEGADGAGPRWLSISAMLADLANSLETGEVFAWGMWPVIVDGMLEWTYEP